MNDEKKSPAISSLLNFSKYSITTIHILIELICFLVIFLYIRRNVRKLQNQIDDLTSIIQQQQEMLHVHQKILHNQNIPQSSLSVGTGNDTSFEVFHIPINISEPQPPSQTIVEEQSSADSLSDKTIPTPPLTDEAIEKELVQEMQELKQEEDKQDEDDDSSSPSDSSNNKKKNRRRH